MENWGPRAVWSPSPMGSILRTPRGRTARSGPELVQASGDGPMVSTLSFARHARLLADVDLFAGLDRLALAQLAGNSKW